MLGIRCIFDENGCLVEYNATRELEDGEVEGYWDAAYFPKTGIIYDFSTNTVREATEEEYNNCFNSITQITANATKVSIFRLYPVDQIICPGVWLKVALAPDDNSANLIDPCSTVHLDAGNWLIHGMITLRGGHSLKYCDVGCFIDGRIDYKKEYGGLYYQRFAGVSVDFTYSVSLDRPVMFEIMLAIDKYIMILNDKASSMITLYQYVK